MQAFWDERYGQEAYAYGELPNVYFKTQLSKLPPGKLLLPAEGEGRNAVFAAQNGWEVSAFDWSPEARKKALRLADKQQVKLDYQVGDLLTLDYGLEKFDAIALIFAHFPASAKSAFHKKINGYLKSGGVLIFEAFSKKHLDYNTRNAKVGGPKNEELLFSTREIESDFKDYAIVELRETEVYLNEGLYHNGIGRVVRFTGIKP
ncbi:MAG: class I SAM-dependent methyltransferase [Bacteroidetes bacterium]|nr:class I SAM-dependent methyltransferase [Bacteroidota bacterium]